MENVTKKLGVFVLKASQAIIVIKKELTAEKVS